MSAVDEAVSSHARESAEPGLRDLLSMIDGTEEEKLDRGHHLFESAAPLQTTFREGLRARYLYRLLRNIEDARAFEELPVIRTKGKYTAQSRSQSTMARFLQDVIQEPGESPERKENGRSRRAVNGADKGTGTGWTRTKCRSRCRTTRESGTRCSSTARPRVDFLTKAV